MGKWWKSERNRRLTLFLVLSSLVPFACHAQVGNELQALREKYRGFAAVNDLRYKTVDIVLNKQGLPLSTIREYSSLFVLTDHAASLAEAKEYFNPQSKLESLKAYSRIPDKKSFRDIAVKHFVKSTEINDGLFYDDLYAYQFTFPSVGAGSRLITESTITQEDPNYPIIFRFGETIPSELSRLTITTSEAIKLQYRLFGIDTNLVRYSVKKAGKSVIHTWEASLPEPYAGDAFSPTFRYFVPHIIVHIASYQHKGEKKTVMETPGDLYRWYYSTIQHLDTSRLPEIDLFTDSLIRDCKQDLEKVQVIFKWVQQSIRYVAIEDGKNSYIPREAALVFKRRYGDCKDKSNLLRYMLNSAGLQAGLAWVGTRSLPYSYSELPSMAVDNHMVCVWWKEGQEGIVLDATTLYHAVGELPASIQGKECLVAKGLSGHELITLPIIDAKFNQVTDTFRLKVKDDQLVAEVSTYLIGENKISLINHFQHTDADKYDKLLPNLLKYASNKFITTGVVLHGGNEAEEVVKLSYRLELPDYLTRRQEAMYINLHIVRLFQKELLKPGRKIAYESEHCYTYSQRTIFDIPQGWKLVSLPAAESSSFPGFSFNIQYWQSGNQVCMQSDFMMNRLIIKDKELEDFRSLLAGLNKAYLNNIVLNK